MNKIYYILNRKWVVKLSGISGLPRISCPIGRDWLSIRHATYKEQQDGFEVIGPFDNFQTRDAESATKLAEHIVELHNASL